LKKELKRIVFLCLIISGIIVVSTYTAVSFAQGLQPEGAINNPESNDSTVVAVPEKIDSDELAELHYPLNKPEAVTYEDLQYRSPADLQNPSNVRTEVEYDPHSGLYIFRTRVGDMEVATPFVMDESEYRDYSLQRSMNSYWAEKNQANTTNSNQFSLSNIQIGIGPTADKIFGPGGVQLKTQGSVDLTFGFKISKRDNPTISIRNRKNTIFDFDTKIQLSAEAKVGDRVNFTMNYNTESTFDFDQKLIKLNYEGKEDDIIKRVEVGNVSMPLSSSLITGSTALFGIRTDLQFGKLKVSAVASQQESERKTITTQGAQTTEFIISASDYDQNRHYFLSTYFYDNYDEWAKTMPNPESGIVISDIQVWVTNRSSFSKAEEDRNIVAFTDLGEFPGSRPFNGVDPLYGELLKVPSARDFQSATSTLESFAYRQLENGVDFEGLNSARLLQPTEYTVNRQLGYISLRTALNPDDLLAVAYKYTKEGKEYQVGEFSADVNAPNNLYVKLVKSTAVAPANKRLWNLYMKNVYSLGSFNIQMEKFKLDVNYDQNDTVTAGVPFPYIRALSKTSLLRILGLDRLNKRLQAVPDGNFDFLEGYTVSASNGRIIFPSTRPFDNGLMNGYRTEAARKYSFPELYDSTVTVAKSFFSKDKFILTGEYSSSAGAEIRLGATNVPRGSVQVTAGGRQLIENQGFTVDYNMGVVRILDEVALESNSPISVSLESQSFFSMQRKTLLGTNLEYAFSDKFAIGGTLMHLSEKPLTQKVNFGSEPVSNTIWGLNGSYKTDWQWLTSMVDKIPLVEATAPSSIAFSGEVAQMIPGHPSVINQDEQGVAYIDDFEGTRSSISIISPVAWALASTPRITSGPFQSRQFIRKNDIFWSRNLTMENNNLSNIGYGLNRSLLAWFYIDPIFTRNDRNAPNYIRQDSEQLSNHFVREVDEREIFQNREATYGQISTLTTLNLSYYPKERGPYNLDVDRMGADGYLLNPEDRWAGIMRRLDNSDFEKSNVEYIEFWLMDPFAQPGYNEKASGKLVFNLGDISEDVMKDARISFEGGLEGDVDETVWGRVPKIQTANVVPTGEINRVDVGLDGLSTENEFTFNLSYGKYYEAIRSRFPAGDPVRARFEADPFSPLNDPAGDNFHHYRGSDYDNEQVSILDRYKYYNGLEGNSTPANDEFSAASYQLNTEDLNGDRTLSQIERYYEYIVDINEDVLTNTAAWESNFIANVVESRVRLENGTDADIKWYQFKIPVKTSKKRSEGGISDFRSIRFIRMYLTGFEDETHLRFGTLELVRTEWKTYDRDDLVEESATAFTGTGKIDISSVNIENDGARIPIPYVLPPGISRVIDPSQMQLRQENEQSMAISIDSLESGDIRAVYKETGIDMRRYDRFKMFVHAESMLDREPVGDNRLWIFVRIGSDFTQNYYEYQIPLTITVNGSLDPADIWPAQNSFNFPYSVLTDLKLSRDRKKAAGGTSFNQRYSEMDGTNIVSIIGNPSIGEVSCMMIGIRNEDNVSRSAEIWINEMRMTGFNEKGGWAAMGNLGIVFSDLGALNLGGRVETVGFGGIEQSVEERRLDDYYEYNISTSVQLGKFFPEKAKVNMPFTYSYSKTIIKPEYDPLNTDLELNQTLDNQESDAFRSKKQKQDSIRNVSLDQTTYKSLALSNVRVGITSKTPMPYDPANFSFSLRYMEEYNTRPDAEYDKRQRYEGVFNYVYSLNPKPVEPFRKMKQSQFTRLIRDFNFYYLPNQLAFSTSMNRNYQELQLRDFNMPLEKSPEFPFMTYDKDWTWDRTSDIKFNLTKGLRLSFSSAMNSLITEVIRTKDGYKDIPVNRNYLREIGAEDWYEAWKDTVWSSIFDGGIPFRYQQRFNIAYAIPVNKLPYLDWVTANAQYTADYVWDKGVELTIGDPLSSSGNLTTGARLWNLDGRLNFETLYNRFNYLKEVNRKYSGRNTTGKNEPEKPKTYERKNVRLRKDTPFRISHRLNSSKLSISVKDKDGNDYPVKYSVADLNTINLEPVEDMSDLTLTVTTIVKERTAFDKILEITARGLMMVRNVNASYRYGDALSLQGYTPGSGFLGQDHSAPGYDFTFGFFKTDEFLEKSLDKSWLDTAMTNVISPAVRTRTRDFQIRALVEPLPGFKIDLNGAWMQNTVDENYSFSNRDTRHIYSRSIIAIGTSFVKSDDHSLFDEFRRKREQLAAQVREENSIPAGTDMMNAPEVIIPAFYSAYTGTDTRNNLNIMPGILSLLPNWKVTYDGLSRLDFIKRYFKSFILTHGYRSTYNLAVSENIFGYYVGTSLYNPSSGATYDTGSSSSQYGGNYSSSYSSGGGAIDINESFYPLIGAEASLENSLMLKAEYRKTRNIVLGIQGSQVVESYSDEYVIGAGYRIDDFGMIVRLNDNKQKKVKNDLNIRADLSFKTSDAFIYRIEENFYSPSSGLDSYIIKFSADYVFSESLNIRLFYDWTRSVPKVSTSYPTTNINFGVGFRFLLVR
jgi:cell surface protein SprA